MAQQPFGQNLIENHNYTTTQTTVYTVELLVVKQLLWMNPELENAWGMMNTPCISYQRQCDAAEDLVGVFTLK